MNRSIRNRIAATALVVGTLGAAAGAHAGTSVHVSVGVPTAVPVHVQPQPVYAPAVRTVHAQPYEVYDAPPAYAYERRHRHEQSCGAPRWDPRVRYMPGQVVWRHGDLFVARRISASVWNENSPPEWTPKYWAQAECR